MLKGVRFRKGLTLAKGIRLNLSKSGVSLSLGKKGMTYNIGPKGTKGTIGLPGSGLSYSSSESYKQEAADGTTIWTTQRIFRWIVLGAVIIYLAKTLFAS